MILTTIADQWQTIVAIVIAASCGVWVLWRLLRPFIGRVVDSCGEPSGDDSSLIQIEPALKKEPPSH
jgi:hypothetical protein